MTNEEALAQLKKDIAAKIDELTFAHYQGDISGIAMIVINKNGEMQLMQAFNNVQAPHIYTIAGCLQRQIEAMLTNGAIPLKPRE
jgi:hypothetical protein